MSIQDLQTQLRAKMFNAKLKDVSEGTKHSLHKIRKALNSVDLSPEDTQVLKDIESYFQDLATIKQAS